jgi:class 3 adenylate cyclase
VDIAAWLRSLGLEQYEQTFRDNAIGGDVLPALRDEHLKELGLPLGHRLKLVNAIAALHVRASEQVPTAPIPPSLAMQGERRQVTVLFADLAGYTALTNELDPEEILALLERFFDRVDWIVKEHGGHIDRHIGDCVMAIFGAPMAHGNDAERAIRAALAIREAIPELSARLGRPLGVHIGVAGGQVVASGIGNVSHREYTVTGDTVNLASRLTDAAVAGEILISERVRRALADRLDCLEAGSLMIKGFAEPVRAWRLRGLWPTPVGERPPFVGDKASFACSWRRCPPAASRAGVRRSTFGARRALVKRASSRSSSTLRAKRASPATPAWCSTLAPDGTQSAPSSGAFSASTSQAMPKLSKPWRKGRLPRAW